jgi:hypothetical protein
LAGPELARSRRNLSWADELRGPGLGLRGPELRRGTPASAGVSVLPSLVGAPVQVPVRRLSGKCEAALQEFPFEDLGLRLVDHYPRAFQNDLHRPGWTVLGRVRLLGGGGCRS